MVILYMAYWGLTDGLTVSVVYPHIELLQKRSDVDKILFVTIERDSPDVQKLDGRFNEKVSHAPLFSKNFNNVILNKTNDFVQFPKRLKKILVGNDVNVAFTHGMVSGSLMHKVCPKLNIPYYVFAEPHSEYMLETGTWKKSDPRYIYQRKWEDGQLKTAAGIYSVTENYINRIRRDYDIKISKKAKFAPNAVDLELFAFNKQKRGELRSKYGFSENDIVGIYVGKFGGIYLREEAFELFKVGKEVIPDLKIVILSPQDRTEIISYAERADFRDEMIITKVQHDEVKDYLSMADFGISIQNPKPSNLFLCPLKNGEYWASGLPIFSIKDVGDDTKRIEENKQLGAIFELDKMDSVYSAFQHILELVSSEQDRGDNESRRAAMKYKNIERVKALFEESLGN